MVRWAGYRPDELHIPVVTLSATESLTPTASAFWTEPMSWLEMGNTLKTYEMTGDSPWKDN